MAQMLKKKTDPTAFELDIAKIFEKTELGLGHLYFNSAKEIELADGKKVLYTLHCSGTFLRLEFKTCHSFFLQ